MNYRDFEDHFAFFFMVGLFCRWSKRLRSTHTHKPSRAVFSKAFEKRKTPSSDV